MKKILLFFLLLSSLNAFSQTVEPAQADKAVVYFVRPNTMGALINFTFYDGDALIARFNGGKYYRYECAPGSHVFWARSENRSYVEADLAAGQIYVIEALPLMGGLKAQVQLIPLDPQGKGIGKPTQKLVTKRASETYTVEELTKWADNKSGGTERGMERYAAMKEKDKDVRQLTVAMAAEPDDFVVKKKTKRKGK